MARTSLVHTVAEQVRARLRSGEWKHGQRLPSEQALSEAFGVSRITLREALRVLEDQGLIERRHGLGSYVTMNSGHLAAGLEHLESYVKTIRRCGYEPEDRVVGIEGGGIAPEVAKQLDVPTGSLGWRIDSIRLASGLPVIYCQDTVPAVLVPDRLVIEKRRSKSLLELFTEDVGIRVRYGFLTIGATVAGEEVVRHLQCEAGEPLVTLKGAAFDRAGRPVYYHTACIRSRHIDLTLVRR